MPACHGVFARLGPALLSTRDSGSRGNTGLRLSLMVDCKHMENLFFLGVFFASYFSFFDASRPFTRLAGCRRFHLVLLYLCWNSLSNSHTPAHV